MKQRLVIANYLIYGIFQSVNEDQQVQATGMHVCWDVKRKKMVLLRIYTFNSTFSEMFFTKKIKYFLFSFAAKNILSASVTKESFVIAKTSTGRSNKGKTPFVFSSSLTTQGL